MIETTEIKFKITKNEKGGYELEVRDRRGEILRKYRDIADDGERLSAFVEKCNSAQISEEHIDNVIEDYLYTLDL